MFDPSTSLLAGMSQADLQSALAAAQKAYVELMTGARGVSFSYTQGDGAKSVTYDKVDQAQLRLFIVQLKQQLGMPVQSRRPARFRYA